MRERVRWVVLTHTCRDHVPGTERGKGDGRGGTSRYGKRIDKDDASVPIVIGEGGHDRRHRLGCAYPATAPNHLCFLLEEERACSPATTRPAWYFSVINPARGGDMTIYLAMLARLDKLRLARRAGTAT